MKSEAIYGRVLVDIYLSAGRKNTINRYRMTEERMVGGYKEKAENYDLLTVLMIHLGDPDRTEGLLRLLNVLLSAEMKPAEKKQIMEDEFLIPVNQSLEQEVSTVCNLSEGVWEKAWKKGIEQGIEQGRQETVLTTAKHLMETLKFSLDQALDAIKIPQAERPKYKKLLEKK